MSKMNDQLKEINQKLDKINQKDAENRCIKRMEEIYKFPIPIEKQSNDYRPHNENIYGFFSLFESLVIILIGLIIYYLEHDFEKYSWYETSYTLNFIILLLFVLGLFTFIASVISIIKRHVLISSEPSWRRK